MKPQLNSSTKSGQISQRKGKMPVNMNIHHFQIAKVAGNVQT